MSNLGYIYDRLTKHHGWDPATAAAYTGNFQQESNGNPSAYNAKEDAFGIAQWRHDRLANLRRLHGSNPTLADQVDFAVWETQNTERGAHLKVRQAKGVAAKAAAVDKWYERSAGTEVATRVQNAGTILSTKGGVVDLSLGAQAGQMVQPNVPGTDWTAQDYAATRPPYEQNAYQAPPYQPLRASTYQPTPDLPIYTPMSEPANMPMNVNKIGGEGGSYVAGHAEAFYGEVVNSAIWRMGNNFLYSPLSEGHTPGQFYTGWGSGWENDIGYTFEGIRNGEEGDALFYVSNARNDNDFAYRTKQVRIADERRRTLKDYDGYAHFAGAFLSPDALITMLLPMGVATSAVRAGRGALMTGFRAGAIAAPLEAALETQRARFSPEYNSVGEQINRTMYAIFGAAGLAMPFGVYAARRNLRQIREALGEQTLRATGEVVRPELAYGGKVYSVNLSHKATEMSGQFAFQQRKDVRLDGNVVHVSREFVMKSRYNFDHNRAAGVDTITEQLSYDMAAYLHNLANPKAKKSRIQSISERAGKTSEKLTRAKRLETQRAADTKQTAKLVGEQRQKWADEGKSPEEIDRLAESYEKRLTDKFKETEQERLKGAGGGVTREGGETFSPEHLAGLEAVEGVRESLNKLHKNAWVEHISRIQDSGYKRVHRNSLSARLRDFMEVLVGDGGFAKASHALGMTPGPSVASRVATYDGVVAKLTELEKHLFAKHLGIKDQKTIAGLGRSDLNLTSGQVNQAEFRRRVSRARISGVKDPIPEVNELVDAIDVEYAKIREVGDKYGVFRSSVMGETRRQHIQNNIDALDDILLRGGDDLSAAARADLEVELDELQADLKMASQEPSEDYFTRISFAAAIRENREAFTQIVQKWMKQQPYVQEWQPSRLDWQRQLDELPANASKADREFLEAKVSSAPDKAKWIWTKKSTKPEAIRIRAERHVQTLLDEGDDSMLKHMRDPKRPVFGRARALDIPNSYLLKDGPNGNGVADFIETNYALVMQTYVERMAPAIEMSRTFARPADGIDWQMGLAQAIDEMEAAELAKWNAAEGINLDAVIDSLNKRQGFTSKAKKIKPTDEQMALARQILDEEGLTDVDLRPFDPKAHPEMEGQVGYFRPGEGDAPDTIFIRGDVEDFLGTVRHETIHALRAANAFDKNEWRVLVEEAMRYREMFDLDNRWKKTLTPDQFDEEAVAELFRYWANMKGHPDALSALRKKAGYKVDAGNHTFVQRIFNKILDIFRGTSRAAGMETTEVDRIFGRVYGRDRAVKMKVGDFEDHWKPMKRDIDEMVNRVTNRIYRDPDRWDNRTAAALKSWGSMTYMGMSALPAMQELGMIAARHGFTNMLKSIFHDVDEMVGSAVMRAGADEIILAGASLDIQKGASLATFAETGVDPHSITRAETMLRAAGGKFQLWNGLAPMTRRLKELDGALRVPDTLARIDRVARGVPEGDDVAFLARYGISPKAAEAMAKQPMMKTEHGWIANTENWTNEELVMRFRSAIRQGNENTILMATHADRPTIVDGVVYLKKNKLNEGFAKRLGLEDQGDYYRVQSGLLSLPFMFWNYGLAATNKIMISGIDEPSMRMMGGMTSMLGLTFFVEAVRSNAWPHMSIDHKIAHVVEKSGIVGSIPEYMKVVSDSILLATGGTPFNEFDTSRMQGLMGLSGAGPTAAGNLIGGAATMDPELFRLGMAGQNHFLFRDLLDATNSGIERNGG